MLFLRTGVRVPGRSKDADDTQHTPTVPHFIPLPSVSYHRRAEQCRAAGQRRPTNCASRVSDFLSGNFFFFFFFCITHFSTSTKKSIPHSPIYRAVQNLHAPLTAPFPYRSQSSRALSGAAWRCVAWRLLTSLLSIVSTTLFQKNTIPRNGILRL